MSEQSKAEQTERQIEFVLLLLLLCMPIINAVHGIVKR